ncbi:MAG: Cytochrome c oxidase polypeptide I [uncultured Gemmatimonadetes bacterium]|uniref:Cytochrome c oxidase subunit 1 n=1 Tax=uncultured Gemmatimonadota bacterium TaxID=203437 RepID=A0A6J4L5S1_9BACT|nr:MAG: Cytochrome c oxidase polypeptide I [uncultured Gemmatimonadota bacterium]
MAILDPAVPSRTFQDDTEKLAEVWGSPPGLMGWLMEVNHRRIGRRYIVTGLALFLLAGLEALAIRTQLAVPENDVVGPEFYRQLFTMHGATMMFLFAVPIMIGVGIYLVPLMIGARDMALPRMNAFGYWIYLIGAIMLYTAFLLGVAPNSGWFNYPPLSRREHELTIGIDVWVSVVTLLEVAALVGAVGLIVTILKQRAPGMSLNRMPVFVWSILVMSFMIVFAMPTLMTTTIFLGMDRMVGSHFFDPAGMGDPLLWQHMFWYFGHPEVYIMFVPGLGMVSMVIATMCRRPIFGYTPIVLSLIATGVLSFGLWVHHMYATGLPRLGTSLFTAASMLVTIPTAVQFFCWTATLWGSRPRFTVAMHFVLGFLVIFLIGGITGVQLGAVPFDLQVHDTFFVVAHFHYVLLGGVVFPLFAGIYYWFPKVTGRMLSERLGKANFWLMFAGVHLAFWPQHHLGFMGMPRRVYTYLEDMGWGPLNMLSTIGAFTVAFGVLLFVVNALYSLRRGALAPADPWGGESLEWATTSPPLDYNFRLIPTVQSRTPLWDADWGSQPVVVGLNEHQREALATTALDARPDHRVILPAPTLVPVLSALAVSVAFVGVLFDLVWVPIGGFLTFVAIASWNRPHHLAHRLEEEGGREHRLASAERERDEAKADE